MIEVDVFSLKDLVSGYARIVKTIEENNTGLIGNFNDLEKKWHDQLSLKIKHSFYEEKNRILNLESNVRTQLNIYTYLFNEYKKIGDKIKCNVESCDLIIAKIDEIIDIIKDILVQINDLDNSENNSTVELKKQEVSIILYDVDELKKSIYAKYEHIKKIENTVSEKLATFSVEAFLLNNFENEV